MNKFPSMQELYAMPLSRLRTLDINNSEEEAMVQTVINAKVQNSPAPVPFKPIHVPDIKNGEEEQYWQKLVDEQKEEMRPKPVSMEQIVPDASLVQEIKPIEPVVKRFCEHCDSKGVRHKKTCPTLNGLQNKTQNPT